MIQSKARGWLEKVRLRQPLFNLRTTVLLIPYIHTGFKSVGGLVGLSTGGFLYMYEWRVNQIRLSMMERVLNHMEHQGFEVQTIIPLAMKRDQDGQQEVLLAGKKFVQSHTRAKPLTAPSVGDSNIDSVYGRDRT